MGTGGLQRLSERVVVLAQLAECLPRMHLASILSTLKNGHRGVITQEVEAGRSEVQGRSWLQIESEASLG